MSKSFILFLPKGLNFFFSVLFIVLEFMYIYIYMYIFLTFPNRKKKKGPDFDVIVISDSDDESSATKNTNTNNNDDSDDDEIMIISTKTSNLPHLRPQCPHHSFTPSSIHAPVNQGNKEYCEQCFCLVCDKEAKEVREFVQLFTFNTKAISSIFKKKKKKKKNLLLSLSAIFTHPNTTFSLSFSVLIGPRPLAPIATLGREHPCGKKWLNCIKILFVWRFISQV